MSFQPTSDQGARDDARLSYIPGIDGLRAIAVIAVMLYHAQLPVWGGFGGVETFFVISGFLITALLLTEWHSNGAIDIMRFWQRRARRLLPPLFAMMLGTIVIAIGVGGSELSKVGSDLPAAIFYFMNWHLIWSGQSYFEPMARPPLLQHLWSLAVEEQFYLVWPLVFAAGMRILRVRGMLILTFGLALGSAILMAVLYRPGADPSRIYYGTDTRAAGVLFGAALAFLWNPSTIQLPTNRRAGIMADTAGLLALSGLLVCFVWMSELNPLLYHGGFALITALTGILIGTILHPAARIVPFILGLAPLRWIGLRSYGLYLWHWPVFMVTRPYLDVQLDGPVLLVLRLAIVGVLVELSYRYIEIPARRGAIGRLWRQARSKQLPTPLTSGNPIRWLLIVIPLLMVVGLGVPKLRGRTIVASAPRFTDRNEVAQVVVAADVMPAVVAPQTTQIVPTATSRLVVQAAPSPTVTDGILLAAVPPEDVTPVLPTEVPTPTATTLPTPTVGPPQPFDQELAAELQSLLDESVADGTIPGVTISVALPGYEPWTGSSGIADRRRGLKMQPDTLIHVGSITKMFTAIVVLQLVQEGLIGLDDPIGTYLPGIIAFDQSTTVRHLLGHRTGLFDYLEDLRFFVQAYRNPDRTWTPEELVGMVDDFGAAFRPGTEGGWKYASTNYVILGMMIEKVTGRSLGQEMRGRIIDPLQMTHTYFAPDEETPTRVAQGYIDFSDRSNLSMTFVWGTGNLISTADDLRVFANALWSGRLLEPEMFNAMTTLTPTGGAYDMPELEYGLGMMGAQLAVGPDITGNRRPDAISVVQGHIGGIAGSRAVLWRVPSTGMLLTLTMNQSDIDPNILSRDVFDVLT